MFKFFKKKKTNKDSDKLPHEIYPEIVFYEKNDELYNRDMGRIFEYISIDEFGKIYVTNLDGDLLSFDLKFLKYCVNKSLKYRNDKNFIKNSDDSTYMKFLKDVKNNYKYLKD